MAYREDRHLEFLGYCGDESLDTLVNTLTTDKDGKTRITETLTASERYKEHYPKHSNYWEEIGRELQFFGGNTFVNKVRGQGVQYEEILMNVCDKMEVNYNSKSKISIIETNLLTKIMTDSMNDMSEEDLKTIADELDLTVTSFTPQALTLALQIAIKQGGFVAYKVSLIVANAIAKAILGRGLTLATNAGITRSIAIFAGPIAWIVTGIWTAIDIAGPAYRVTIPAVIQVAYLRQLRIQKGLDDE